MLVGERMSRPVITVHPDTSMQYAVSLIKQEGIRRLPVVDKRGRLVGIVSERDLLHASPSDATLLSVWESNYLIFKIHVEDIMTRGVITVTEETPLEEAARIMADNKIGGLPVMRGDEVIGIITETDLFKVFVELLGARSPGVRLSAVVPDYPGELAQLTKAIYAMGGNIVAMGTFLGEASPYREVVLKIENIDALSLEEGVLPFVERILDIREWELA